MRQFDLAPLYRSRPSASTACSRCSTSSSASMPPRPTRPTTSSAPARTPTASRSRSPASPSRLSIEVKENTLTDQGEKKAAEERKGEVLYQGIAARTFERRFQLADGVQVTGAALENGLLHVDLVREIPEAKKPRQIPIASGRPAKTIEARSSRPRKASCVSVDESAPGFRGAFLCGLDISPGECIIRARAWARKPISMDDDLRARIRATVRTAVALACHLTNAVLILLSIKALELILHWLLGRA